MKYIVVLDIETLGLRIPIINDNPSSPIQIAALCMEYETLKKISEFSSYINAPIEEVNSDDGKGARSKNKISAEDIEKAPPYNIVWRNFVGWARPFGGDNKQQAKRPILAGQNIINFDTFYIQDACRKFGPSRNGEQTLFQYSIVLDVRFLYPWWFDPRSFSMDSMLPYFGIRDTAVHNAVEDVRDTAWIIAKFLSYHRKIGYQRFKDGFKGDNPYGV